MFGFSYRHCNLRVAIEKRKSCKELSSLGVEVDVRRNTLLLEYAVKLVLLV